jgi:DNA polymerase III subunit epsilon
MPDSRYTPSPVKAQQQNWPEYFDQLAIECQDHRLHRYYAGGVVSGDTAIINTPLVAMDFETTGMNVETDEIVSMGLVPFSLHRIFCRESAHWLVKPRQALTEGSVVIHGITHSDINAAPDLEVVLEALLTAITGRIPVVHYRHIERAFLARALLDRLGEAVTFPVIDTMAIEHTLLRRRQRLVDRLLKHSPGGLRLGDCRERYGLPHYHAHHALTDALATAELLQAQIAYHFSENTPLSEFWL